VLEAQELLNNLGVILKLAENAGQAILQTYEQKDLDLTLKPDLSPLTRADSIAHELITAGLNALQPALPVLSEESKLIAYEERQQWITYWLVDPLDGTKEFLKRNGQFTTNIALVQRGEPVLGVIHAPALGLSYYAAKGHGAYKKRASGSPVAITVRRGLTGPPRVAVSRSHSSEALPQFLEALQEYEELSIGSSLKFCLIAEGTADLYPRLGPTMEWDTAAGQCIVETAGGSVTDLQGNRLRYNKRSLFNPHFVASGGDGNRIKSSAPACTYNNG